MLNDSILQLSLGEFKNLFLNDLTLHGIALTYVLVYVLYKTLGRYIYFKPQEHSSKINRTFLLLSILVIVIHLFSSVTEYLPFHEEYRWLYTASLIIIILAPLSMVTDKIIWRYGEHGYKYERFRDYLPIEKEYYRTAQTVESKDNRLSSREEEGIRSTSKNIHSDALLNILALVIFVTEAGKWAHDSAVIYGKHSYLFFVVTSLWVIAVFVDRSVISWIKYLEHKYYRFLNKNKPIIKQYFKKLITFKN